MKKIAIIGGGAASLMLAAHIDTTQYEVTIYEQKKSVGRKFLVAGEGGLNLTYSSPIDEFVSQYSPASCMESCLRQFTNKDLREWLMSVDIPTFVGSSNRVFPLRGIKPVTVLKHIVDHLYKRGVEFQLNTTWIGWKSDGSILFDNPEYTEADVTVFALGGASWRVTGSDGTWAPIFAKQGIKVIPFEAANCAFEVQWDKKFIATHRGKPLKNIALSYNNKQTKGELVITKFGLEGNALYALSKMIQKELATTPTTTIQLDLKPNVTQEELLHKYAKSKHTKVTEVLKEDLHLDRTSIGLIKQYTSKETFLQPALLTAAIKSLPIILLRADDIDKAISTLGGIHVDEIGENFELAKIPNTFAIGEMIDWYAPTGGYLLQGCFSMGYALAQHLNGL